MCVCTVWYNVDKMQYVLIIYGRILTPSMVVMHDVK